MPPNGVRLPVRAVASRLESDVTVTVRPFTDFMRDSMATAVLASDGAWGIGLLGLVLAIVGAFGVFANDVEERRHEIGVRRAVGAGGRHIVTLMMRTAVRSLLWGLAVGLVLSLLAAPLLRHFLYGLSPFDPIAYAQVGGILAVATGVAIWLPTRRAISVDPATTLRD
jgi:putative ABC transport system permease protein